MQIFLWYYDEDILKPAKEAVAIFESLILLHLTALCEMMVPEVQIFYWRTVNGKGMDFFFLEYGRQLIAIEIKFSDTVDYSDTEVIRVFL